MTLLAVRLISYLLRHLTFKGAFPGREREVVTAYVKLRFATPTWLITGAVAFEVVALTIMRNLA